MRILIIEDEELLGDGIRKVLVQAGYTADWVPDGSVGEHAVRSAKYDVLVLDLNLPGASGFEVLQRLRRQGHRIPVLVLTARGEVADRIRALDGGADDYVVKPFDVNELCARIRALHRRGQGNAAPQLRHGDMVLDAAARAVTLRGEPVALSTREFGALRVLLENQGRVLSRQRLEDALYGWDDEVGSNAVEVHVHHLRKKLGNQLIRTVRGVGYIIEKEK